MDRSFYTFILQDAAGGLFEHSIEAASPELATSAILDAFKGTVDILCITEGK